LIHGINGFLETDFFEVFRPVFADRADEVFGEILAFIEVAADLATPADLLFLNDRFRFDVRKIIGIGEGRLLAKVLRFGHFANEEGMGPAIDALKDSARDETIRGGFDVVKAIGGPSEFVFEARHLVAITSRSKAETLDRAEGSLFGENRDIEDSGLRDEIVRVV
jgi:hypothetical protein